MKFITLVPTTKNDGTPFDEAWLKRIVERFWRPFRGMQKEGPLDGRWMDAEGKIYNDACLKISIECDRDRLQDAIKAVKKLGRKLEQKAMYLEVTGYDGVQFLYLP